MIPEISPEELAAELRSPAPPTLVDVREDFELEISVLPGVVHIPLGEFSDRFGELDPAGDLVIVCRTGGRSARVTQFLLGQGYPSVRNLATGMNGYAATVDPSLRQY